MKYTPIEIAGMLQDNQDTISKLKQEVKKLKELLSNTYKIAIDSHKPSSIEGKFQEDAINAMYDEQDDHYTGF